MDIAELAKRIGLPTRLLRYVCDHQMLPQMKNVPQGRGVPRSFGLDEAFSLALAAALLHAGLKRGLAETCLEQFAKQTERNALLHSLFFREIGAMWLEIGDAVNWRMVVAGYRGPGPNKDDKGQWRSLAEASPVSGAFKPVVTVRIDVVRLYERMAH